MVAVTSPPDLEGKDIFMNFANDDTSGKHDCQSLLKTKERTEEERDGGKSPFYLSGNILHSIIFLWSDGLLSL